MSRIFLVSDDGALVELNESAYPSEDHLQDLLARYPDLLPGDEMDPQAPRRWLLVSRETGVPDQSKGGNRWSLDHLFLDQDGVPTLVEVKRSTDTRLRREVVGQMLDYAANGVAYWPVERIQALFVHSCEELGADPDLTLDEFLSGVSPEEFWKTVKTNLQAGRVRMVFVADEITNELSRIVEFLNSQMDPAEVFAVEIPRYSGGGLQTLVPRLIGQTAEASTKKSASPGGARWDEPRFLSTLEDNSGAGAAKLAEDLIHWSDERGLRKTWGRGAQDGSFFPILDHEEQWYAPFALWTYGLVEMQFQYLKERPAFASVDIREELRQRFNLIEGVDLPADGIERRPSFRISLLAPSDSMASFKATVEWMLDHIRSGNTSA